MNDGDILVFGGTGFVGRSLVHRLVGAGYHVTVVTRDRSRARHLSVFPQLDIVEADIHTPEALTSVFQQGRFSAVLNLAATLSTDRSYPYGAQFEQLHVKFPKNLVMACHHHKIPRLIHMSASGAALTAPSAYLRSRFDGDQIVLGMGSRLGTTVVRPSVIFGVHDSFTQRFAGALRASCGFFPLLKSTGRFQPIWVEDVVSVLMYMLDDPDTYGRIYPLGGPSVYSLRQMVELVARGMGIVPRLIPLPYSLSYLMAGFAEYLPGPLMLSRDMLAALQVSSVAADPCPYGIQPREMEDIVACYFESNRGVRPQ